MSSGSFSICARVSDNRPIALKAASSCLEKCESEASIQSDKFPSTSTYLTAGGLNLKTTSIDARNDSNPDGLTSHMSV